MKRKNEKSRLTGEMILRERKGVCENDEGRMEEDEMGKGGERVRESSVQISSKNGKRGERQGNG